MAPAVAVVTLPDNTKSITLTEKESALLERYAPVLRSFLDQNLQLQLMALHSLQVYCYSLNFPKGWSYFIHTWYEYKKNVNPLLHEFLYLF